jgi:hypothetical protein
MIDYLTVRDVALALHVSPRRVTFLAQHRKIGQQLYPAGPYIFKAEDVERMRPGKSGRPKGKLRKEGAKQ